MAFNLNLKGSIQSTIEGGESRGHGRQLEDAVSWREDVDIELIIVQPVRAYSGQWNVMDTNIGRHTQNCDTKTELSSQNV